MLKAHITLGSHRLDLSDRIVSALISRWEDKRVEPFAKKLLETTNYGELDWTLTYKCDANTVITNAVFNKHKTNCFLMNQIDKVSGFLMDRTDDELITLIERCSGESWRRLSDEFPKREKLLDWALKHGSETLLRSIAYLEDVPADFLSQLAQHQNQSIALLAKYKLSQRKD